MEAHALTHWLFSFSAYVAMGVNVLLQWLAYRLNGQRFFHSVFFGFSAGVVALCALEAWWVFEQGFDISALLLDHVLVDWPCYGALAFCFFAFIQLGQSSVRVRVISELLRRADGLQREELERDYSRDAMLEMRLERLVVSGDLKEKEGRYFGGRQRFIVAARGVFALKRALLRRETEF